MKLTLTIQDIKSKEGEIVKGVFGTLNITKPDKKGIYNPKKNINFVTNLSEIKGLPKIVRNIQVSVLGLKHEETRKKKNDNIKSKRARPIKRRSADKV